MKQRCLNPRSQQYQNYGARGIKICARWLESYQNFLADMGEKPSGLTLERRENDGNYEPENCKWADRADQRRNQRNCVYLTMNGMTLTAEEWSRKTGFDADTIKARKRAGYSDEDALSKPRLRDPALPAKKPSGLTGVSWHEASGKWRALIGNGKSGKKRYLGVFDTKEEAYAVYLQALSEKIENAARGAK